jgi:hypothetical protein
MPYEAFARGDGGARMEKRAAHGTKTMHQQKRAATQVKRGRTYGFTAAAGSSCGTYKYWKDGRCQDARDKRGPWKAF